jgi:hypothetical protein
VFLALTVDDVFAKAAPGDKRRMLCDVAGTLENRVRLDLGRDEQFFDESEFGVRKRRSFVQVGPEDVERGRHVPATR